MNKFARSCIDNWYKTAEKLKTDGGDLALFWAGKMSMAVDMMIPATTMEPRMDVDRLAGIHWILDIAHREFDMEIFRRT